MPPHIIVGIEEGDSWPQFPFVGRAACHKWLDTMETTMVAQDNSQLQAKATSDAQQSQLEGPGGALRGVALLETQGC